MTGRELARHILRMYEPAELEDAFTEALEAAAAPDVLKALQDIIAYTECVPRDEHGAPQQNGQILYELYQNAKAAIAAATGAPS